MTERALITGASRGIGAATALAAARALLDDPEMRDLAEDEMRRTFNCGVGMIAAVAAADLGAALARLGELGETAWHIGSVADGAGAVEFR